VSSQTIWISFILFGLVIGNAILAWLHFAETNHSPRTDLISSYAHSSFPRVYLFHNFTFVVAGIGASLVTHAITPHSIVLPGLCLTYSFGIAILAIFPMDESATVKTYVGALHVVGVVLVFAAATFYSALMSHLGSLALSSKAKTIFDIVTAYLVLGIIFLLVAQFRQLRSFGLIERIAAAGLSLWLIAILLVAK